IEVRAAALLAGRVEICALTIGEAAFARLPAAGRSATSPQQIIELPHLPVPVALDRLSIERLTLAPPVLADPAASTIAAHAGTANVKGVAAPDPARVDGNPGQLALTMTRAGAEPKLTLHLAASEPSGLLLDRLLARGDRLPLNLALDGSGPLADWRGRLAA